MKPSRTSALEKLTKAHRALERIVTALFVVAWAWIGWPSEARAQIVAVPETNEPAATARDLATLKEQIRASQAAADARAQQNELELQRLRRALDEERAARAQDVIAARAAAEDAARAIADQAIVRSKRIGVTLSGFVQADAQLWRQSSIDQLNPSTGAPLNEERFMIRRARVRVDVDSRWVSGALELDGNTINGAQARIIGAEASFIWRNRLAGQPPLLQATIGLFKTPFGFEIGQSDRDRLFLERSNAERALFPGEYDLGFRLQGGWRFVRYMLGAMNGDPLGEKLFPGRDPNESKDLVGRFGIDTHLKLVTIQGGFSFDWGQGFHKGTPATKDQLVWHDTNEDGVVQASEITVVKGSTATPSASFNRYVLGGDLELTIAVPRLGDLVVYGEIYSGVNLDRGLAIADPVAQGRDLRELGYYIAATQEFTKWGMIGVRYDRYDPDRDSNDVRGGVEVLKDSSYSTLSITGAVRYPGYGRVQIEYQHNTNPLGRLANGAPATVADDLFTIRGQVQF